jgi:hypothetical protein
VTQPSVRRTGLIEYQGKFDVVTVQGSMALRVPRSALPK